MIKKLLSSTLILLLLLSISVGNVKTDDSNQISIDEQLKTVVAGMYKLVMQDVSLVKNPKNLEEESVSDKKEILNQLEFVLHIYSGENSINTYKRLSKGLSLSAKIILILNILDTKPMYASLDNIKLSTMSIKDKQYYLMMFSKVSDVIAVHSAKIDRIIWGI